MAAGDTTITMIGNLVDDPELRFTPSGAAVAKFRVASTPRYLDKATNEWKDGESLFLEVEVDEVGPSLRNATAKVTRAQRAGGTGGAGGFGAAAPAAADSFNDDPWAAASPSPAGGGWATTTSDEPPF